MLQVNMIFKGDLLKKPVMTKCPYTDKNVGNYFSCKFWETISMIIGQTFYKQGHGEGHGQGEYSL